MRTQHFGFVDFLLLAIVIAAIPVGAYHASNGLYAQAVIALGAAAVGFAIVLGWNPGAVAVPGIEPVSTIDAHVGIPAFATVAAIEGTCARTYHRGDTWAIDGQGRISRPICRAAAASLASKLTSGIAPLQEATCRCPLRGGQLTFAIRTA